MTQPVTLEQALAALQRAKNAFDLIRADSSGGCFRDATVVQRAYETASHGELICLEVLQPDRAEEFRRYQSEQPPYLGCI